MNLNYILGCTRIATNEALNFLNEKRRKVYGNSEKSPISWKIPWRVILIFPVMIFKRNYSGLY